MSKQQDLPQWRDSFRLPAGVRMRVGVYGTDSTGLLFPVLTAAVYRPRYPDANSLVKYAEIIFVNSTPFCSKAISCPCDFMGIMLPPLVGADLLKYDFKKIQRILLSRSYVIMQDVGHFLQVLILLTQSTEEDNRSFRTHSQVRKWLRLKRKKLHQTDVSSKLSPNTKQKYIVYNKYTNLNPVTSPYG